MKGQNCRGIKATYNLEESLGQGGQGQAWKARVSSISGPDEWLAKPGPPVDARVVIKWANIQPRYTSAENREFLNEVNAAISRELFALERLSDLDCVARVYDYGIMNTTLADGSRVPAAFLVEQYLEGTRFDEHLLERYGRGEGESRTFSGIEEPQNFLQYATRLSCAVQEIHHRGVIHGDIWERNIMVLTSGKLCLFDLGASAIRDTAYLHPGFVDQQRSDTYCAPERRRGERHGRRSDIYSLGGVFYYMATGMAPPAPIPEIEVLKSSIVAALKESNPHLIEVNRGIADIIARCLRYNKDQRTRDTEALLDDLRLFSCPASREIVEGQESQKCVPCLLGEGAQLDSLFARMLLMDMARVRSRAEDMKRGVFEVSGDHEELVARMSAYLSVLGGHDQLLARTTPRFWKPENMGINGRFLSLLTVVAGRGAIVKHVMLVCESDRDEPEVRQILDAHLNASASSALRCGNRLQFFCENIASSDERRGIERKTNWEQCYTISAIDIKALQPVYDQSDVLRTVRFVRQEHAVIDRILDEFTSEISDRKRVLPLSDWLKQKSSALDMMRRETPVGFEANANAGTVCRP